MGPSKASSFGSSPSPTVPIRYPLSELFISRGVETRVLEVFQFFSLYVAIAQNLIALTPVRTVVAEADGSDEPVVTTDIGAAIWTMEVVATEAGMELE